jgi:hypothetical protein
VEGARNQQMLQGLAPRGIEVFPAQVFPCIDPDAFLQGYISAEEFLNIPELSINPLARRLERLFDTVNFKVSSSEHILGTVMVQAIGSVEKYKKLIPTVMK